MRPFHSILAASDLSDHSAAALARAAQLAHAGHARMEALHILEPVASEDLPTPAPDPGAEGSPSQALDDARALLERQVAQVVPTGVAWAVRVETGKDFLAILRRARHCAADLIVVGARGSHSPRELLLGTTAEKLARKADRPVLVVKRPSPNPYRRLLVPTDFSAGARAALLLAMALAPEARIDLLHVYTLWSEGASRPAGVDDQTRQQYRQQLDDWARGAMSQWLQDIDLEGRTVIRHYRPGRPGLVVPQLAAEVACDLIAMGSIGRSGLFQHLLGSVAEQVLRDSPCDMLLVRPQKWQFEFP